MEKQKKVHNVRNTKSAPIKIPVLNIRMMTDEEWNKLAYKNYLERKGV